MTAMVATTQLVDRLFAEQLDANPDTARLYRMDARFHQAVHLLRQALCAVAENMWQVGIPVFQVERVLQGTLDKLVGDDACRRLDPEQVLGGMMVADPSLVAKLNAGLGR